MFLHIGVFLGFRCLTCLNLSLVPLSIGGDFDRT